MSVKVIQIRGHLTRKGHRDFDRVLELQHFLYNCALRERIEAYNHPRRIYISEYQQSRELTEVRAHYPEYNDIERRVETGTLKRLDDAYNAAFKRKEKGSGKPGFPHFKPAHKFKTIQVYSGASNFLKRPENAKPYLKIKGIPKIKLRKTQRLPDDGQPLNITITRKPNGIYVSMAFPFPDTPAKEPPFESPVGINRGVARRSAMTTGEMIPGRDRTEWDRKKRRLQRKMQGQRDAAIREGRAITQFRGIDRKTKQPRFKFIWLKVSKSYLKTQMQLLKASHRENVRNKAAIHQITTAIANAHDAIFIEDFDIPEMVRSAKGTAEHPGTQVKQKTKMNKAIAEQNWGMIAEQLAYKVTERGGAFARIESDFISQTCPFCDSTDHTQTGRIFTCNSCSFKGDIDIVAAWHILSRGMNQRGISPPSTEEFPPDGIIFPPEDLPKAS